MMEQTMVFLSTLQGGNENGFAAAHGLLARELPPKRLPHSASRKMLAFYFPAKFNICLT